MENDSQYLLKSNISLRSHKLPQIFHMYHLESVHFVNIFYNFNLSSFRFKNFHHSGLKAFAQEFLTLQSEILIISRGNWPKGPISLLEIFKKRQHPSSFHEKGANITLLHLKKVASLPSSVSFFEIGRVSPSLVCLFLKIVQD